MVRGPWRTRAPRAPPPEPRTPRRCAPSACPPRHAKGAPERTAPPFPLPQGCLRRNPCQPTAHRPRQTPSPVAPSPVEGPGPMADPCQVRDRLGQGRLAGRADDGLTAAWPPSRTPSPSGAPPAHRRFPFPNLSVQGFEIPVERPRRHGVPESSYRPSSPDGSESQAGSWRSSCRCRTRPCPYRPWS